MRASYASFVCLCVCSKMVTQYLLPHFTPEQVKKHTLWGGTHIVGPSPPPRGVRPGSRKLLNPRPKTRFPSPISLGHSVIPPAFLLDATLLRKVIVKSDGEMTSAIATSVLKHDVTGGVREKLQTASNIIRISERKTRVFVTNIMSEGSAYSVSVLGALEGNGTEIIEETDGNLDPLEHQ